MPDAVVIPGGGLLDDRTLPPYVAARLDRALWHAPPLYITLSAGTTHKPLPVGEDGLPYYESMGAAKYLAARGVDRTRILVETSSYDTIGNAFFARVLHVDPRGLRKLLIITSEFHMARTEATFRWVFGLSPWSGYELTFEATESAGISVAALAARHERERTSLESVTVLMERIKTLDAFHQWFYTEHKAYAWFSKDVGFRRIRGDVADTY